MKLFICTDKNGGVAFNHRRQSMDRAVRARILEIIGNRKLFLNSYTATPFEDPQKLAVSDDFIAKMDPDDFCFVESGDFDSKLFDEIYVFNWNRNYPFDQTFSVDPTFKKVRSEQFAGTSHDKITLTVYRREVK